MNTTQMLTRLFPKTKNISEVVEILEKYKNFGINTNLRLAHFLAQARTELKKQNQELLKAICEVNSLIQNILKDRK